MRKFKSCRLGVRYVQQCVFSPNTLYHSGLESILLHVVVGYSGSLKTAFLATRVPRTLRQTSSSPRPAHPAVCGDHRCGDHRNYTSVVLATWLPARDNRMAIDYVRVAATEITCKFQ